MSEQGNGADLKKFYWLLAVVGVVGLGAVGYSVGSKTLSSAASEPVDLQGIEDDTRRLAELAKGVSMGDAEAPVTIIEFGDYQCPACAAFSLQVKPLVKLNYVDTGRARFVFYDFPLSSHRHSFLAARAARCADDQGKFWEYHDYLYRMQRRWPTESDPRDSFVRYAEELGLNRSDFSSCLNSDRHADVVTANLRLAQALGLPGTPSVLVGKGDGAVSSWLPNFDFTAIQTAVEEILSSVDGS